MSRIGSDHHTGIAPGISRRVLRSIPAALTLAGFLLLHTAAGFGADIITKWNNALLDSIRTENTAPCLAARNLAIVHGAMYDAAVAIRAISQPFFFRTRPQPDASLEAAINAAAFETAVFAHPSRRASFLEIYNEIQIAAEKDSKAKAGDILGRKVAKAWIDWRSADGTGRSIPYIPKKEPGAWKRTLPYFRPPDLPAWCLVQPFTMVGAAQFRPPGPPALESSRYAEDLNALKDWGGVESSKRTPEQSESARFWSDFSYTVTPPGHWNQIAQEISDTRKVPLVEKARLFALMNISMADAGIACWEAKYFYNFWRPVTAIRAASEDRNPETTPDANWKPFLSTPSFPEYVSGHSAFSNAGATVLKDFFGTDQFEFTVPSDSMPGKTRSYHSLDVCANEISQSRLYGGIHFPSALQDGLALGEKIATHVVTHFLRPADQFSNTIFEAPAEMTSGYWIGANAFPGQAISLERLDATGDWRFWTNGMATSPIIRWKVSDVLPSDRLRVVVR